MITLSPEAINQLQKVLGDNNDGVHGLRIYVNPGGCSGFSYGMGIDDHYAEDDEVIEQNGMLVFVDAYSAQYLDGAEVDYVDSLMGGGFTVHNPQAVKTCSCGQSFDTGNNDGLAKPCGSN